MRQIIGLSVTILLTGTAIADDLRLEIAACAGIEADSERLACFDALAQGDQAPQHRDIDAVAATAAITEPASAAAESATTGEESAAAVAVPAGAAVASNVAEAEPAAEEPRSPAILEKDDKTFVVRITRCGTSAAARRQVYYFDNGEVWQQSNTGSTTISDCDTEVLVRRDAFGYKMEVPSENRKIRIRPVR